MKNAIGHERPSHPCQHSSARTPARRAALRERVPADHVLAVLMDEHQRLLRHLDRLQTIVNEHQTATSESGGAARLREVKAIAASLLAAAPHHRREEEVLFPALQARGIHGPTQVMEHEHGELRAHELELARRTERALEDGGAGWPEVTRAARAVIEFLRAHIAKEDEVLYPLALRAIPEPAAWSELRRRCDAIGYCCGAHG